MCLLWILNSYLKQEKLTITSSPLWNYNNDMFKNKKSTVVEFTNMLSKTWTRPRTLGYMYLVWDSPKLSYQPLPTISFRWLWAPVWSTTALSPVRRSVIQDRAWKLPTSHFTEVGTLFMLPDNNAAIMPWVKRHLPLESDPYKKNVFQISLKNKELIQLAFVGLSFSNV